MLTLISKVFEAPFNWSLTPLNPCFDERGWRRAWWPEKRVHPGLRTRESLAIQFEWFAKKK